jgi:hypothetical protein
VTDPIADALDAYVPAFAPDGGDWDAILETASPAGRESRRRLRSLRPQRRPRPLVLAAGLLVPLVVATAAVAVGIGVFDGIGAAQHPAGTADVLDPATAAMVQANLRGIQLDTTRHIGQLPDGQDVYVITGTQNDLCTVLGPPHANIEDCGAPLSAKHPASIFTYYAANNDPSLRYIVFGVAIDGVTSVTFKTGEAKSGAAIGPEVTVPVKDNLWVYEIAHGPAPTVLQRVTAHFADGSSFTMGPTGKNCAAC